MQPSRIESSICVLEYDSIKCLSDIIIIQFFGGGKVNSIIFFCTLLSMHKRELFSSLLWSYDSNCEIFYKLEISYPNVVSACAIYSFITGPLQFYYRYKSDFGIRFHEIFTLDCNR